MPDPTVAKSAKPRKSVAEMSPTLEIALRRMNDEFVLVESMPAIVRIPTVSRPDLHVYSRGEFISTVCANRYVGSQNVAQEWMKWRDHQKAYSLTYAPGKPQIHDGMLNTWVGPSIKPIPSDLTLWFNYLDHIFASDSTYRDWFLAWLAYPLQNPGAKLHTACVFWSTGTSTGKSTFGYLMAELYGQHNFAEIDESQLHGNFNHWAARRQFVMGEEIKGANAQRHADYLKSIITRKHVTINTKNTPQYVLPDCINYFFTSNHAEAFYLDETDRRFFVHELSPTKFNADYARNTFQPWLHSIGHAAILHYLLNEIDLSRPIVGGDPSSLKPSPFNPYSAAPATSARRAMIEAGRDEVDIWLDDFRDATPPGWTLATPEDLFRQFKSDNPDSRIAPKAFSNRASKAFPKTYNGNAVTLTSGKRKRLLCVKPTTCVTESSLITQYEGECVTR